MVLPLPLPGSCLTSQWWTVAHKLKWAFPHLPSHFWSVLSQQQKRKLKQSPNYIHILKSTINCVKNKCQSVFLANTPVCVSVYLWHFQTLVVISDVGTLNPIHGILPPSGKKRVENGNLCPRSAERGMLWAQHFSHASLSCIHFILCVSVELPDVK